MHVRHQKPSWGAALRVAPTARQLESVLQKTMVRLRAAASFSTTCTIAHTHRLCIPCMRATLTQIGRVDEDAPS